MKILKSKGFILNENREKEIETVKQLLKNNGLKVIYSEYGLSFRKYWKDGWFQLSLELNYDEVYQRWEYIHNHEPYDSLLPLVKLFEKITKRKIYVILR